MPKSAQICDKVAQIYQNRSKWWCLISASEETATPPPKKWWSHLWTAPKPSMICEFFVQCTFLGKQLRASFQVCCARLSATLQVLVAARGFATFVTFILSQEGRGGQRGFNATLCSFFLSLPTIMYSLRQYRWLWPKSCVERVGEWKSVLTGLGKNLKNKPERETNLDTGFFNDPIKS